MEAVECGAAALGIVLGYYGRIVPLEELRVECGVSRDGSKANNVLQGRAQATASMAKGFKHEELDEALDLQLPVILFWNFNHFVVLEGFGGGKVLPQRPGAGARARSRSRSSTSLHRASCSPSSRARTSSRAGSRPQHAARRCGARLAGSGLALLYVMLCGLLLVVPGPGRADLHARLHRRRTWCGGRDCMVRPLLVGDGGDGRASLVVLTWLQQHYLLRLETKLALLHSSRLLLARPAAAGGLLRAALRRRDRLARRPSTTGWPT